MGADMFLVVCAAPIDEQGNDLDMSYEHHKNAVLKRIACWNGAGIQAVIERTGIAEESEEADARSARAELIDCLWVLGSRQVATFAIPMDGGDAIAPGYRRPYLATGGMSWGDSPTDAYDALELLDLSGVFEEPFHVPAWLDSEEYAAHLKGKE
jgi:hypothetical protein